MTGYDLIAELLLMKPEPADRAAAKKAPRPPVKSAKRQKAARRKAPVKR